MPFTSMQYGVCTCLFARLGGVCVYVCESVFCLSESARVLLRQHAAAPGQRNPLMGSWLRPASITSHLSLSYSFSYLLYFSHSLAHFPTCFSSLSHWCCWCLLTFAFILLIFASFAPDQYFFKEVLSSFFFYYLKWKCILTAASWSVLADD